MQRLVMPPDAGSNPVSHPRNEGLNQYAVYRLRRDRRETRSRRHQTYQYLEDHQMKVESGLYEQVFLAGFDPKLTKNSLRALVEKELPAGITGETLAVSDVLAITRDGITGAYYVDPDRLVTLLDFFHMPASVPAVTIDTSDFQIEGRPGNWAAIEENWIDGRHFFLMQSMQFGKNAAYAVVDSRGRQAAEDTLQGFTDEVIRQIRDYIRKQDEKEKERTSTAPPSSDESDPFRQKPETETNAPEATAKAQTLSPKSPPEESSQEASDNHRKRRKTAKRKKGKRPLRGRKSILERLRYYQMKLRGQQEQAAMQ